jgi:hypothetical protein
VLNPLECIVLEKEGMRNPLLVWVIICSLYSASITRTFKFSTKKKVLSPTVKPYYLFPPVCHCACIRMAVIKIWQYFNLRCVQKFLINEITNKNYSPFFNTTYHRKVYSLNSVVSIAKGRKTEATWFDTQQSSRGISVL